MSGVCGNVSQDWSDVLLCGAEMKIYFTVQVPKEG
jgi:hypothetical protein